LSLPVRTDYGYRRFNVGRYHGKDAAVVDSAIRAAEGRWKSNPDVPVREGDSLTSVRKRLVKNVEKLIDDEKSYLLVTDTRTIAFIRSNFNPHDLVPNGNTP